MIKAVLTDFDGTLVDTFRANYEAYLKVLKDIANYDLTEEKYRECYGLKFNDFMDKIGIHENKRYKIRLDKNSAYKDICLYRYVLKRNDDLYSFLKLCKSNNIKVALVSTAQKTNIEAVLHSINIPADLFDYIVSADDVTKGKPDPQAYNVAMQKLGVSPDEVLAFEDSEVGIDALKNAGINNYIKVVNI